MPHIRCVTTPNVPEPPVETFSNCLVVDGIAYIAGMTARGREVGTIEGDKACEQTQVIFCKIRALIKAAGGAHGRYRKAYGLCDRYWLWR